MNYFTHKVCVLDLVQLLTDNLSLHFYNQSETNSEDNTKLGPLNKIQYRTDTL